MTKANGWISYWHGIRFQVHAKEDLSFEEWERLQNYVVKVLKPDEPRDPDWGSPFGFVGVGEDPMHDSQEGK